MKEILSIPLQDVVQNRNIFCIIFAEMVRDIHCVAGVIIVVLMIINEYAKTA
jgi:hypothetical protein